MNKKIPKDIKKNKKKIKKIEDSFSDSLDDFEDEIKEKNDIERLIKGEKEIIAEDKKETVDKTVNKNINEQAKAEPEKTVSITKRTRKESIIDSILEVYKQLNVPETEQMTFHQLKATKINILERKLADLTEKLTKEVIKQEVPQQQQGDVLISDDVAVQALFNVNIIMTQFVENLAEVGRQNEMTKDYVPNINGMTQRLLKDDKQKQLKECLKGIIAEHGESIKPYLSPVAIWLMFMVSNASETVAENMSKNLDEATTKSQT